jgi:hypothetical protein
MSKRYMKRKEYNAIIAGLRALQRTWNRGELEEILSDGVDGCIDDEGIDQLIYDLQSDDVQLHIEGT